MNKLVDQKYLVLKAHGKLPSPRGIALQIIRLAENENTNTRQIAHLISGDPVFAGRVIKVANLLCHHEGRQIISIMDAVTVQGIKSVCQLALSLSLVNDYHSGTCPGFDYQKFWKHSVCIGLCAQLIATEIKIGVADEAFLLGLLSQVGRLALATVFPEDYSQILAQAANSNKLAQLEHNAFGLNHSQLTALMLSDWGLPKLFQEIASHIEKPELSEFHEDEHNWHLLQVLHFAEYVATVCTSAPSERNAMIPGLMLLAAKLGIERSALIKTGDQVISGLIEWGALLNIPASALPPFEVILNAAFHNAEPAGTALPPGAQADSFKLRILLVDDDRTIRLLYKTILEKLGHSVHTASDGIEALEYVKANPPQLIISDWMMPGMDGIEFCYALRKNPEWNKIYVFIVTAQESNDKLIQAFEAGANDYLSKPVNAKVLAARLRSAQRIIQMQEAQEEDRWQLRQFADNLTASNKRLQTLALTDMLTGLPNRILMQDRLQHGLLRAQREGARLSVTFIDLDHFKEVNDSFGHDIGDLLLQEVAARIQKRLRAMDTVARFGGDEFVILMEDLNAREECESLAQELIDEITRPMQLQGHTVEIGASMGIAYFPDDCNDYLALMKYADMAMYAAKSAGRNTYRFFKQDMHDQASQHLSMEADLRSAVAEAQLQLFYQIQVDSDHRPIGAEALLRWNHPTRGMIPPDQFISIAEESSLIVDLGDWVLEAACRQLANWAGIERTRHLTLAVNVSAIQFKQADFVEKVACLLQSYQIKAYLLKLELTEGVVLSDISDVIAKMHTLKKLGIRLSMDDFGTGYSSLSYLTQLPLDQLKIDQSFVRNIVTEHNAAIMVKTIIDMALNFGLDVIAEGVETEAQLAFLKQNDCINFQGYFFSRPVPIEQFEDLLK